MLRRRLSEVEAATARELADLTQQLTNASAAPPPLPPPPNNSEHEAELQLLRSEFETARAAAAAAAAAGDSASEELAATRAKLEGMTAALVAERARAKALAAAAEVATSSSASAAASHASALSAAEMISASLNNKLAQRDEALAASARAVEKVEPKSDCSTHHPKRFEPSLLESYGIL